MPKYKVKMFQMVKQIIEVELDGDAEYDVGAQALDMAEEISDLSGVLEGQSLVGGVEALVYFEVESALWDVENVEQIKETENDDN